MAEENNIPPWEKPSLQDKLEDITTLMQRLALEVKEEIGKEEDAVRLAMLKEFHSRLTDSRFHLQLYLKDGINRAFIP